MRGQQAHTFSTVAGHTGHASPQALSAGWRNKAEQQGYVRGGRLGEAGAHCQHGCRSRRSMSERTRPRSPGCSDRRRRHSRQSSGSPGTFHGCRGSSRSCCGCGKFSACVLHSQVSASSCRAQHVLLSIQVYAYNLRLRYLLCMCSPPQLKRRTEAHTQKDHAGLEQHCAWWQKSSTAQLCVLLRGTRKACAERALFPPGDLGMPRNAGPGCDKPPQTAQCKHVSCAGALCTQSSPSCSCKHPSYVPHLDLYSCVLAPVHMRKRITASPAQRKRKQDTAGGMQPLPSRFSWQVARWPKRPMRGNVRPRSRTSP